MKDDFHFKSLSLSWKILVTCFLIVLGSGYLAAVFNAVLSVGTTSQAIADHYADKSLSPEEAEAIAKQGYVEEELSLDDDEEEEMSEEGGMGDMSAVDHEAMMSDDGQMNHSASGDDTLPPQILAQVSHVHLLSFSLILLTLGGLACLTQLSETFKAVLIGLFFFGLWLMN